MAGIAETAKLVSSLELKDNFTPTANKAMKSLGRLESTSFKVGQGIGKGLNNAARNIGKIAVAGGVALAGAVALGVRSLADLNRSQEQTAAVIASTGGKAKVSAAQVREYAENLENVTTVDDKVIQDGENLLLTFTNIGSTVFPQATKAALDMAVAMAGGNVEAVDLKGTAIQLGKALNDPATGFTALKKAGVSFDDAQIKILKGTNQLSKEETKHYNQLRKSDKAAAERYAAGVKANKLVASQKLILAELNKEFGKAGEAAGKGPEAVMRRLEDAGEGVSQVLARATLPALERLGTFLTEKLSDKGFLDTVDKIGVKLGGAADTLVTFLEGVDFNAIGATLMVAADAAGTLVGWFMQMPSWVQAAVIGGWGLNKLTGGALGDIVGTLAGGLVKGVLGMNAGVVNLTAGTVVGGGAGVPAGGVAGAAKTGLSTLSKLFLVGEAIGLVAAVNDVRTQISSASTAQATGLQTQTAQFIASQPSKEGLERALSGVEQGIHDLEFNPLNVLVQGEALDKLRGMQTSLKTQIAGLAGGSTTAVETAKGNVFGPEGLGQSITDSQAAAAEKVTTEVEGMKGRIATDLAAQTQAIGAAATSTSGAATSAGNTAAAASRSAGYQVAGAIAANRPIVTTDVKVYVTAGEVTKSITTQDRVGPANGSAGGNPSVGNFIG